MGAYEDHMRDLIIPRRALLNAMILEEIRCIEEADGLDLSERDTRAVRAFHEWNVMKLEYMKQNHATLLNKTGGLYKGGE